jgi:flagellar hook-length control protein FliK
VEQVLQDAAISFNEVMNSMASPKQTWSDASNSTGVSNQNAQTESITNSSSEYDKYQYRSTDIRKSQEVTRSMDDATEASLENYNTDVKEVLKEELNVTDEQIAEAMSQLGLTYLNLTDSGQLSALVSELTEITDASELLCSTEFLDVMQQISELSESLLQELGITVEELTAMVQSQAETLVDTVTVNPEADVLAEELPVEGEEILPQTTEAETDVKQTDGAEEILTAGNDVLKETQTAEVVKPAEQAKTETSKASEDVTAATENVAQPEEEEVTTASNTKNNSDFSGQRQSHDNNTANVVLNEQTMVEQPVAESSEAVSNFGQQLDVENIIKQIVEFTKITVSSSETTMEMQLNPEHLGKIYLELTSKAGNVSAHITAQNEAVREALEAQIITLKENLNQAGVKVDAVEVTVGSHEFEKNLEQNAKEDQQQAEEREKAAKQTRNIRLGELDELSGVMTEEEVLVAQMMAEQGNSINFTA